MTAQERSLAILKFAFIVSCLLFLLITLRVPSRSAHAVQPNMERSVAAMAVLELALAFAARPLIARFAAANAGRLRNRAPLAPWMYANILSLTMIESSAVFGMVLHLLGGSEKLVGLIFGCALLAFLIWRPGTPPAHRSAGDLRR